ncbi:MAG TPA: 1-(5-phosphoribosyl)-5-[(5-phosphoribosylamino)methylideneamino] imidazole-4-carboxamide isomerase [Longimicrobiales bacterium]|nr:1-(5-phosphoribosyl)-5-[(5-phosphoribosylamino)methylideneamino] imidazole-4-carboxamide isomerase [Longimicrobiales bacterium]
MTPYAAIDLRGGRVVQLVGGKPGTERVSLPDAVAVARDWVDVGFRALHVVDLDAALGSGSNRAQVLEVIRSAGVPVQVGGGIRDDVAAAELLDAGASRVIVGTRAAEDPTWLAALAGRYPDRIVVAADVRGDHIVTRGWTADAGLDAVDFLQGLDEIPLGAVLVTDVTREGQMMGIDEDRFRTLVAATRHPLLAAGGIGGIDDVRILARCGAAGAVLGMALYTGAVDARALTREFA